MLHSPPHLNPSTTTTTNTLLLPHISNFHFLKTSTKPSYFLSSQQFPARPHLSPLLAQLPDSDFPADGPVEPPSVSPSLSPQTMTLLLSNSPPASSSPAPSPFSSFFALRRCAKRAKELKFRSTGATNKSLKEEAIESLKAMTPIEENAPPSALQALLGGLSAGVVALILYKFTTTIEASLNRQTISDNFSVRQITITIRTIINGMCYLATFVFGINSLGLILYSGQLALNSIIGILPSDMIQNKDQTQLNSSDSEINSSDGDQDSNRK